MKVECIKNKLKEAVAQADRAAGKNLALPILSSILIETTETGLRIKATNLDLGVELMVSAKVHSQGSVAVSGSLLNNYLNAVRGDTVVLEVVDGNLALSSAKTSTLIKAVSSDDFPEIPRIEIEESISIEVNQFVSGLHDVLYAAAVSDIKPEISSIFVYTKENQIVFVSTDSFRLAERSIDVSGVTKQDGFLIPYRNALEIVRILQDRSGSIEIGYTKNQTSFLMEGLYLTSRLVGGVFPQYEQIIPTETTTSAVILKKDIIDALKVTTLFSDKFNRITLKVLPKEGLFEIESRNSETGENTVQVDATLEGGDITHAFNAKLILDCFQSISTDAVQFLFAGEGKPLVIKPQGDTGFRYLVMPMIG